MLCPSLQVISADMRGYIVADDVRSILVIAAAASGDYERWTALRQQHLQQELSKIQQANHNMQQHQQPPTPAAAAAAADQTGAWHNDNAAAQHGSVEVHAASSAAATPPDQHRGTSILKRHGRDAAAQGPAEPSSVAPHAPHHRHWRSQLMHSSSFEMQLQPPPTARNRVAAVIRSQWSATVSSLAMSRRAKGD